MISVVVLLVAVGSAALTVAAFTSWGVRQRFEPFDAILLSIAAYLGFLVMAGLALDLVFDRLTRPYLLAAVAAAGLVSAAALVRSRRTAGRNVLWRGAGSIHRPTAGAVAGLVTAVLGLGCVIGAVAFSRSTEQHLLVQHDVALYFDASKHVVAVHNPTPSTQRLSLSPCPRTAGQLAPRAGSEAVSIVLAPGQTWRAAATASAGRCEVVARQVGGPTLALQLNDETMDVDHGSLGTGW